MPSHQKLSIKQGNFARHYVELDNASEPYRRAYDAEKCSEKTVWRKAITARVLEERFRPFLSCLFAGKSIAKNLQPTRTPFILFWVRIGCLACKPLIYMNNELSRELLHRLFFGLVFLYRYLVAKEPPNLGLTESGNFVNAAFE